MPLSFVFRSGAACLDRQNAGAQVGSSGMDGEHGGHHWFLRCVGLWWGAVLVGVLGAVPRPAGAQSWAAVTGTVVEAEGRTALVGAHVLLRSAASAEVVRQTATDACGDFAFARVRPGRYVVEVQQLGYAERRRSLWLEVGESRAIDVALPLKTEGLMATVWAPSRQRERRLEVPVSVSVVEPERLWREMAISTGEALRSMPGVEVAQTGVARRRVLLRGGAGGRLGGPHVRVDHRAAAMPLLGQNVYGAIPVPGLDVRRVEVVRGAASALYGPGASEGVVHTETTNPFRTPGTAVSVTGGSRRHVDGQIRRAGVVGGRVGYAVTAQFGRADEWGLDPQNPQDAAEIQRYYRYGPAETIPAGRRTVDRRLRRKKEIRTYRASGRLRYRLGRDARLSLRGGYASLTSPLQTGIGTLQADGLAYSYGQLRVETPSLTAQLALTDLQAGEDLYRLRTGTAPIDESRRWSGLWTTRVDLSALDTRGVLGGEATLTRRSGAAGGGEGIGAVDELGVYVHTRTPLASSLSLTLAARGDYSSIAGDVHLSPRAALVYTPWARHALRASYNRSLAPPAAPLQLGARFSPGLSPALQSITQTVEVGYRGTVWEGAWLDLAGYYAETKNVVTTAQAEPLTYRRAGRVGYGGVEVALEARPRPSLTTFVNASSVWDDAASSAEPEAALEAPSFRLQGGADYGLPAGASVGATVHYVDAFPVRAGPYVGPVDRYALIDLRAGTPVPSVPGAYLTLTAKNVLGNEHREFIGAPELGRFVRVRLTYAP